MSVVSYNRGVCYIKKKEDAVKIEKSDARSAHDKRKWQRNRKEHDNRKRARREHDNRTRVRSKRDKRDRKSKRDTRKDRNRGTRIRSCIKDSMDILFSRDRVTRS